MRTWKSRDSVEDYTCLDIGAPDLMHGDRLRCVFGAHLIVSSSCWLLSAGFPALLGRAWSQNCPKRKKRHCRYTYLTWKKLLRCRFYHQVDQWSSYAPHGPWRKHLSSGLLRDTALMMCPLRLLSSCPTCSIRLSTPGLCLISSLSLKTSSGDETYISKYIHFNVFF